MKTYKVRIWKLYRNRSGNPEVRWRTENQRHSRSFANVALAESFRSELIAAQRQGEAFHVASGLPVAMTKKRESVTWYDHAAEYAAMKWPESAPNTRRNRADALATVTPALTRKLAGAPGRQLLRDALYGWAFSPSPRRGKPSADVARALAWVKKASLTVEDLADNADLVRSALRAISQREDGSPAAATTFRRKRMVFNNALRYACERKLIAGNPLSVVQWKSPEIAEVVDRRVVVNPKQLRQLLDAVRVQDGNRRTPRNGKPRGEHLVAFFGCLYFAALRPAEAVDLCESNCTLPETGWGALELASSNPRAGHRFTDTGAVRQRRELKWRARGAVRTVPIPPEFVKLLRNHVDEYGVADDGRLFQAVRGGVLHEKEYGDIWRDARAQALTAAQVASPLAGRPYDLRHAGVSLWLRSGVDVTEVARRAGHSVDVLLRIYASVLDDTEKEANKRIEEALEADDDTADG
ncbi:MAG: tyrosine-type recombinase/integrase [Micromonosporaceae bacterium]